MSLLSPSHPRRGRTRTLRTLFCLTALVGSASVCQTAGAAPDLPQSGVDNLTETKPIHSMSVDPLSDAASVAAGSAPASHPEYAAVKHCIEQSIGWAIEKDFDAMFRLWADDLFHFWVFSNSTVVGLDAFKRYADQWRDPDFRGTRFEFRDLRIRFSRSGDVAWYSTYLDDCITLKGEEHCMRNVFQTGVLEKRDGRWVHVQMHGSYPVDRIPDNLLRQFYAGRLASPTPQTP